MSTPSSPSEGFAESSPKRPSVVTIDRTTFVRLVKVAEHVSRGEKAAHLGLYPDASARFALGALHEAGLLPLSESGPSGSLDATAKPAENAHYPTNEEQT